MKNISQIRKQVLTINKATLYGTANFKGNAEFRQAKIKKAHYRELQHIYSDTMAVINGKTVITQQNLQYMPAKFYYYELD